MRFTLSGIFIFIELKEIRVGHQFVKRKEFNGLA